MSLFTMQTSINVVFNECAECGTVFGMDQHLDTKLRESGKLFYCPNGHTLHYGETELDRLRRSLKAKEDALANTARRLEWEETRSKGLKDSLGHTERRLAATKGVLTRTRNRVAAGVCPCCSRTFADLQRHMAGQHPGYAADQPEEAGHGAAPAVLDEVGGPPPPGQIAEAAPPAPGERTVLASAPVGTSARRRGRPPGGRAS